MCEPLIHEPLMPIIENNSLWEENVATEDFVCVTHKVGDWQKMLRYLYDNDGNSTFIPAYPLSGIIESEMEPTDQHSLTHSILMDKDDAQDVLRLSQVLELSESWQNPTC